MILDELGYVPLGEAGSSCFTLSLNVAEQGSLIITSNLEFSHWVETFDDPALTSALLDPYLPCIHIEFDGESTGLGRA